MALNIRHFIFLVNLIIKRIVNYSVIVLAVTIFFNSCKNDFNDLTTGKVMVESVILNPVFPRVGKSSTFELTLRNKGDLISTGKVQLTLPASVTSGSQEAVEMQFAGWSCNETKGFSFSMTASNSEVQKIGMKVIAGKILLDTLVNVHWNPAVSFVPSAIAPAPQTVETGRYLIGAQRCDLWKAAGVWDIYKQKYLERQPVIGWYNEGEPEVTDWEIKYALEHGIRFFVHCWYRDPNNYGNSPIVPQYDHVIKSYTSCNYGDLIKFTIDMDQFAD